MSNSNTNPNDDNNDNKNHSSSSSADALMIKLRNISDNVTNQEMILKSKTNQLEIWYNMHKSALLNVQNVKKKLSQFVPINEEKDNEEIKTQKTKQKTAINLALDNLSAELKSLSESETKYRSTECLDELSEQKEQISSLENKYNILLKHNKALLEENNIYQNEIESLKENHDLILQQTKKDLFDRHKDYITNLQQQHEGHIKSQQIQHENALNYQIAKLQKDQTAEKQVKYHIHSILYIF